MSEYHPQSKQQKTFLFTYISAGFWFILSFLVLFILWGYDAREILIWQNTPHPIRHWGGVYLNNVAVTLYQWFGTTAYSIPMAFAFIAFGILIQFRNWLQAIWLWVFCTMWLACFLTLFQPSTWSSERIPARGGILGVYLVSCLNFSSIVQQIILYSIGLTLVIWILLLLFIPHKKNNSPQILRKNSKNL